MRVGCSNFWKTSSARLGKYFNVILFQTQLKLVNLYNRYKEPTEILSQRVEALNTQRTEKLNRVKLVEKEKDELAGPKDEAMAYIRLENDLAQSKYTLQQVNLGMNRN